MILSPLSRAICRNSFRTRNVTKLSGRFVSTEEIEAQGTLDGLYTSIRQQKFEDIVVIKTRFDVDPRYLILATAFNHRHLINGTEEINKSYKREFKGDDQMFAKLSISKDWNVMDFYSVVVHLFSRQSREQFDIEQLWTVGDKYDDLSNPNIVGIDMNKNDFQLS